MPSFTTSAERWSIAAIVVATMLVVGLEHIAPYNKGQRTFREGFFDDFALYTMAQSYILGIVIFSFVIVWLDRASGLSRLHLLSGWPVWLQVAFFVVAHDFYIYWMHRWQHRNKYLWRIHEAHHSPEHVDWLSGSRSHALEILINQTVEFAPVVLLGASPSIVPIKGAISAIWGVYIHANLNVNTGWLQTVINGPEMHRWHHTMGRGMSRNFSTKLAMWDWVFGTAYRPRDRRAERYGVRTWFPKHYVGQTLYAFRRFHAGRAQLARPVDKRVFAERNAKGSCDA